MKTIAMILTAAALLSASTAKRTFTGVITDKMCGASHAAMKVTPDAKCVRDCAKAGSQYALLEGKNLYTLSHAKAPDTYAGQRVRVSGTLDEKTRTIQVESIAAVK
jgi:hypothetical protein